MAVSMTACGPEDPGSNPRLAKVCDDAVFFLGVFMIQFNLIFTRFYDLMQNENIY